MRPVVWGKMSHPTPSRDIAVKKQGLVVVWCHRELFSRPPKWVRCLISSKENNIRSLIQALFRNGCAGDFTIDSLCIQRNPVELYTYGKLLDKIYTYPRLFLY